MCGISIWCAERKEWVTKWDGAENTDIEAMKGGLSGSMKRAAVQWGIGRYLYKLESAFADCFTDKSGKNRGTATQKNSNQKTYFTWNPPALPHWALPEEERPQQPQQQPQQPQPQQQQEQPYTQKDANNLVDQYNEKNQPSEPVFDRMAYLQKRHKSGASRNDLSPEQIAAGKQVQQYVTPKEVQELRHAIHLVGSNVEGFNEEQFCTISKIRQIGMLPLSRFEGAIDWLFKQCETVQQTTQPSTAFHRDDVQPSQYQKRTERYKEMGQRYAA